MIFGSMPAPSATANYRGYRDHDIPDLVPTRWLSVSGTPREECSELVAVQHVVCLVRRYPPLKQAEAERVDRADWTVLSAGRTLTYRAGLLPGGRRDQVGRTLVGGCRF